LEQIDVIDTVVKYLIQEGWVEVFTNRPGNDYAAHGCVVPVEGKIVDAVLFNNNKLMLIEADSRISLKNQYHTKLLEIVYYLKRNEHLSDWITQLEQRNHMSIGRIEQIIPTLAYYQTDFRLDLIKPDLVSVGFNLYRTTPEGGVIEEHQIVQSKLDQLLKAGNDNGEE